ncbi:melanocortin receptor 4-like [Exaiptasia diaphana]|uniref:G-protein coupled receptors family 1 profile domain-containing protein n=1 Tax=Exaiptasia diaphana TaxID=2652724 RepID=A0A913Y712_EXADI|nr:melanocortin receptor 4-like [Exaiptasia diaphana]
MAASNTTSTCLISPDFEHYNITDLPDSVLPVWTVLAYVNGIAAPLTAVSNALIICAVFGDQQLRSKAYTLLLAALAVGDLLVGLVVEPLYCWFFICLLKECGMCIFTLNVVAIGICNVFSMCTLMMVSVERYLAIELPIWHRVHVTPKRVKQTAAAIWLTLPISMITFVILLNKHETLKKLPPLRFTLGNIALILYCTVKVAITAYSKTKTTKPKAATQQAQQEEDHERKLQIQEFKRGLTLGILVLTSVILYFPSIIFNIIHLVNGKDFTPEFKYIAQHIILTLINLQSFVNPFIMALRIKKIRKSLKIKITSCLSMFNGN